MLWLLGVGFTGTACYSVYAAATRYLPTFSSVFLAALLLIVGAGILVYWGFVLLRGVRGDK